jgi:acyl-CoA dehydrogenase
MMQPGGGRDRLTAGIYIPCDEQDAVGALEAALASRLACEPLQQRLRTALKSGKLTGLDELSRIVQARNAGLITAEQALQLERDEALYQKVIQVDDFAPEAFRVRVAGFR